MSLFTEKDGDDTRHSEASSPGSFEEEKFGSSVTEKERFANKYC